MRLLPRTLITLAGLALLATGSLAGSWQKVVAPGPAFAGLPMLLTDGSVMVHNAMTRNWWKLKPDINGSYVNGTWTTLADLPVGYGPLYYASAVLSNGLVVISGGEYNLGVQNWTNQGAWYDPVSDVWTNLPPPAGWSNVGDTQCVVMPDGTFVMARLTDTVMAALNPSTLTWSNVPNSGKVGQFNEEGWTLMPNGGVMTVDCAAAPLTQKFIPATLNWISTGNTPTNLVDTASLEMGPQVLLTNGKMAAFGGTGHNAIYTPGAALVSAGTWAPLPDLPLLAGSQLKMADAPACLLPSGNVLVCASPGVFATPTVFYEFNGASFVPQPATPLSAGDSCFQGNMLMLPTGQVLYTDFSNDVEIYTPVGAPSPLWRPVITSSPAIATEGQTFVLTGKQLNGLSQCSSYGDDNSNATNYPIVRITNISTGHVFYCRTFNHSSMGVATGAAVVTTSVTVPAVMEPGPSRLEVVANGIASLARNITITVPVFAPISVAELEGGTTLGGLPEILNSDGTYYRIASALYPFIGQAATWAVEWSLPATYPNLTFSFKSHAMAGVSAEYFVFDWVASSYVFVGSGSLNFFDTVNSFTIAMPPNYYGPGNHVNIAVRARLPVPPATHGFTFFTDQVKVNP